MSGRAGPTCSRTLTGAGAHTLDRATLAMPPTPWRMEDRAMHKGTPSGYDAREPLLLASSSASLRRDLSRAARRAGPFMREIRPPASAAPEARAGRGAAGFTSGGYRPSDRTPS